MELIIFTLLLADLVGAVGWAQFFALTFVIALPGLWAVWLLRDRIMANYGSRLAPAEHHV